MEDIYWIWLSRIKEIGPITIIKLLKFFKTPENIWNATENDLIESGFKGKVLNSILNMEYRKNLEKYLDYMNREKIHIIKFWDEFYPKKLKNIYALPIVLYAKGDISILDNKGLAIVGCRKSSLYGEKISYSFSYNIAKENINIISGMARGIDTCAHTGAINANGKTVAVMGCGLDTIYPSENKNIYYKIIETGGVVLSEYIIGTKPIPDNFPRRNRIISGLSDGVLVVEAKKKSGTLITVDYALEQGRDLYVVPGNIDSPNSYGTNELIKQGALSVTSYQEIIKNIVNYK